MQINNDCEVLHFTRLASQLRVKNAKHLLMTDIPPAFAYVLANELRANQQIKRRCGVFIARLCNAHTTGTHNHGQKKRLDAGTDTNNTAKAAELLIISATAEIIGITRRMGADGGCSERVFIFCEKVVESENDFIGRLRGFL
ncbi:MAG: hypothetical protein ACERKO_08380 [Acetanaerobacterium sp.]